MNSSERRLKQQATELQQLKVCAQGSGCAGSSVQGLCSGWGPLQSAAVRLELLRHLALNRQELWH